MPESTQSRNMSNVKCTIGNIGYWSALILGTLGFIISFYPGASAWWFGTAAVAAVAAIAGMLSANGQRRCVSAALAVVFSVVAVRGYQRGLEYQEWIKKERVLQIDRGLGRSAPAVSE